MAQNRRAQARNRPQRITDIAVNDYGIAPEDLIFDTLTFTLATGDPEMANSAVETMEGIRLIKAELPGVLTSLGVSNVSFGLGPAARGVLNSVFLYHAVQAGLDMAIVNPAHITPYAEIPDDQRKLANDLIFNEHPDALPRFIQYFRGERQSAWAATKQTDPTEGMTAEEALHWQIVHRKKEGVEALIDDCLTRQDAVGVLNNVLLPAMKEVGDKFGAGELILPFVLQSAEVMKKTVAYLENFLERKEGTSKGAVVLATVYGDVHDIGKNLVKTILSNNGYTVHDLGKQMPANTIIETAHRAQRRRHRPERAAGQHVQADAAHRQRTGAARPEVPGADRRRSHQPALRAAHPVPGGRRRTVRARRVLLQGRLRGPGHDGAAYGSHQAQGTAGTHRGRSLRRSRQVAPARARSPPARPALDDRTCAGHPDAAVLGRAGCAQHAAGFGFSLSGQAGAVPAELGREKCPRRGMGSA